MTHLAGKLAVVIVLLSSCTFPTTTPTGTIAFSSSRSGNPEIYLINADGTGLERLTYGPSYDSNPVFSPDGQHIAFNSVVDGQLSTIPRRDSATLKPEI